MRWIKFTIGIGWLALAPFVVMTFTSSPVSHTSLWVLIGYVCSTGLIIGLLSGGKPSGYKFNYLRDWTDRDPKHPDGPFL